MLNEPLLNIRNIIFDLDDTLIECGKFYAEAKGRLFDYTYGRTGMAKEQIETIFNAIDMASCALPDGFGSHRFPRSFAATSAAIDNIQGHPINMDALETCRTIGKSVFDAPYPLFEGALDMLTKYRSRGFRLYILTKGEYDVQWKKVHKNGLTPLFESKVEVVPRKNVVVLHNFIDNYQLRESETVYVGDSLRDDIGPANALGITSVWVSQADKPKWGYENTNDQPNYTIEHITDLPNLIPHTVNVSTV